MPLLQLQVKLQKTEQIAYLEERKEQTRYRLTYLDVSKSKKSYDWYLEGQMTAWKESVTFLAVKKKNKSGVLGVFRVQTETKYVLLIHFQVKISENGRKNLFRDKQTTNDVVRC